MPRRRWTARAAVPAGGLVVALVLALVLALVVGGVLWWRSRSDTPFEWAVARAPAGAQRLSWTDWAAVREHEDAHLSTRSSPSALRQFLGRAFDDDLDSTSALVTSAPVLQQRFGFSPASADWELFSQSYQGAVVMLRLPDSVDLGEVADDLQRLGYRRPGSPGGVWRGGQDLVAEISPSLTPELSYVAIDAHDRLVLMSDNADYLALASSVVAGQSPRVSGLSAVVDDAGDPLSAAVYSGAYACGALAMAHAPASDRAEARRLIAQAGEVNPYTAFAMSDEPDGSVRVAFSFESSDQARTNADTRAALARGPAPGQGGTFGQRFLVDEATARGSLVVMRLTPRKGAYVLSDLSTGPLLFATC